LGDLAGAEDALGDAFLAALERWPLDGVPEKPEAWLLHAARNRMIDAARRNERSSFVLDAIYSAYTTGWEDLNEVGSTHHAGSMVTSGVLNRRGDRLARPIRTHPLSFRWRRAPPPNQRFLYLKLLVCQPVTSGLFQNQLLEASQPRLATGSCQEEASRDRKHYFSLLAPPSRIFESLHYIFALQIGIELQNLFDAATSSYHSHDHAHSHPHTANARPAAHG
jgi:hypothetical protein